MCNVKMEDESNYISAATLNQKKVEKKLVFFQLDEKIGFCID